MSFDSFQALCRILSPFMAKRNTRFRAAVPIEKRVAIGLWRLGTGESYRSTSITFGVGFVLCFTSDKISSLFRPMEGN